MSILLKSSIFVAGVPMGPTDGTLTYAAAFEAELVNRGAAVYVGDNPATGGAVPANLTTDKAGAVTGILGPNGIVKVAQRGMPIYLFSDSLYAQSTAEVVPTAGTITLDAGNLGGYIAPTPVTFMPTGTVVRVYGFTDARLNFTSTVVYSGGARKIKLPAGVDYTGINTTLLSNALATGQQRAINYETFTNASPMYAACALAGKRWNFTNMAHGGCTSAQLAQILPSELAGKPPGLLLLGGMVNTTKNGESDATIEASYRTMIVYALSLGHEVALQTPTTFSSALASYATYNAGLLREASMLRRLAVEFNLQLLDAQSLWLDRASIDGQPKAGYVAADGIHWSPTWVLALAPALNTLLDYFQASYHPQTKLLSIWDSAYTQAGAVQDAANTNKVRNGQLFGAAAALPDGWTQTLIGAPTVAYAKSVSDLSATDGTLSITYSGAAGSSVYLTSASFHADCTAGKKASCIFEIEVPVAIAGMRIISGLFIDIGAEAGSQYVTSYELAANIPAGVRTLYTLPWTIPADVTSCKLFFRILSDSVTTSQEIKLRQFKGLVE